MDTSKLEAIRKGIRLIPDFPKKGIAFQDLMPFLSDGKGMQTCVDALEEVVAMHDFEAVVSIESRGFIFGAALAARTGAGFVPVRKPGKLPGKVLRKDYALEYGTDALEVQLGVLKPGLKVLIVDDVLATGGTAEATIALANEAGCEVVGAAFILAIEGLAGWERLQGTHVDILLKA